MQFRCDFCETRYRANISDARVLGSRLIFTCRTCGRDVVVVGGGGESGHVHGSLLPDHGEGVVEGLLPPESAADGAASPAAVNDVFGEVVPKDEVVELGEDSMKDALSKGAQVTPPSAVAPQPPLPISVPEKKGGSPILVGLGIVAAAGAAFALFVMPSLSTKKPGAEAREESAGPPARTTEAGSVASAPRPSAAPTTTAPLASQPTRAEPASERVPVVEIRELPSQTTKPTPAPSPHPPTVRDAGSVIDAAAIEEAFVRARPGCKLCAVTEVQRDPGVKLGTVTATLTIGAAGAVIKVDLDRADLTSSPLGKCVSQQLLKMTFPPFGGAPVVLRRAVNLDVPGSR